MQYIAMALYVYQKLVLTMALFDNSILRILGYKLIRVYQIKSKTRQYFHILQRLSPNKSNQCKLFEVMLKFQSECKWKTVWYHLDLSITESIIMRVWHILGKFLTDFELLLDNIANRNPFVSIIIADFIARQKLGVFVKKQLMKVRNVNPWLPNVDLDK